MDDLPRWTSLRRRRWSRRAFLRASARAAVGVSGIALVGCGGDDENEESTEQQQAEAQIQQQTDPQAQQAAQQPAGDQSQSAEDEGAQAQGGEGDESAQTQAPSPRTGGIMRLFHPTDRHDRWDPHRSRFRFTQPMHALMYNRLVRPVRVSTSELEPDLAGLPEIPDDVTYIFTIRPDARFWEREPTPDGRGFQAEDVRYNVERQIEGLDVEGNPDPLFYRQEAYSRTDGIETPDARTVRFTTAEPDAGYLTTAHAGPWGWMTSREAVEEFGTSWRNNTSDVTLNHGTGPYLPVSFTPGGELVLRRSANWWGDGAFADGIVLAASPPQSLAGLYASGQIDRADFPLTNEAVRALRSTAPNDPVYELPMDAPVQMLTRVSDDPESAYGDPRVLRALGLALDRFALIDRLYAGDGRPSGPVPWFLEGWALAEDALLGQPGYRPDKADDLEEVQGLISAAGGADILGGLTIIVADLFEGFFPGVGASLAGSFSEALGLEVTAEYQPYLDAVEAFSQGSINVLIGWGRPPYTADPTDAWLSQLHSDGAENWSNAPDPTLDEMIEEMRGTLNTSRRQALAGDVQAYLLERGSWIQNVANGVQLGIRKPYLHLAPGVLEYAWAMDHLRMSWIDTDHEGYPADARALPADPADQSAQTQGPSTDEDTPPTPPGFEEGSEPQSQSEDGG